MISIPENVNFIFESLESKGYDCYAVGGCVRDSLMGKKPDDWDFTTSATPEEIIECFKEYKLIEVGKKYGTIGVCCYGCVYEVTTFRCDGDYQDSRHPDKVFFASDISDDLLRRDFTINSMAFNKKHGLIDPFGGRNDLDAGIIRCTGDPYLRFDEDAIRIVRALRFASRFGFEIEAETDNALIMKKQSLDLVHPKRLNKELSGILMGRYACDVLDEYRDVIGVLIPEIKPMFDFPQNNPHHSHDVWTHTIKTLDNAPYDEEIRFCLLFHDIGKPFTRSSDSAGIDHFKGHQTKSSEIAKKCLSKFGFSGAMIRNTLKLIEYHDERFKKGDKDIKRMLNALGKELFFKLMTVSVCDKLGQSEYRREEKLINIEKVKNRASEIIELNECYSLQQLDVKGTDIEQLGFFGKEIGVVLNNLLDVVIEGRCENKKDELLNYVIDFLC